ncbi:MAG: N-6 DNA methylase, partial [Acidimicrobiia bacterium]|nr:N-6 DNA methylase [Acidimicrobiia bacterium]
LQHMVAVLKKDGIVATVMPHGVLFRGGAEGKIRQAIIEDDLLDTVIGLGPNLFYGTGIPTSILILRAKGSKPKERRGKVLFINADRDYGEGRARNHLRTRDEEKITATYRAFADVPGFAKVVTLEELAENDFNCNIRRYADSSPPPEPHDVRAHLHGGVPVSEIDDAKDLLQQAGLDPISLLIDRGDGYADWCHYIASPPGREAAHKSIRYAVSQRAATSPWPSWWVDTVEPMLRQLPDQGIQIGQRLQLIEDFTSRMVAAGVDRFAAAGMAATWWENSFFDLQIAAGRGWKAVLEAWLTTAEAGQEDKKTAPPLSRPTGYQILAVNGQRNNINTDLIDICRQTLEAMTEEEATTLAINELRGRVEKLIADHYAEVERQVQAWYDNLVNKYGETLSHLEAARDKAQETLKTHLKRLGYG